ncbi:MAG: ribonuclease HI [Myxococcales bacterium]|nr:ribonuclease HI [Myxococcales bacterium]
MPQFICASCNKPFEVVQETLDKYPGWKPRFCIAHRKNAARGNSFTSFSRGKPAGTGSADSRPTVAEEPAAPTGPVVPRRLPPGHAAGSRTFGRGLPTREVLTPEEALEKYPGGPSTGVFTDGGCEPNPGPGGWGFVHVIDGEIIKKAYGGDRETTNNRMEMTAIIRALDYLPADSEAVIYSDSDLCVKTLNEWSKTWKAKGWQRKGGAPIANLDLVIGGYEAFKDRPKVRIEWIRAHDGSRWNEYADALATVGLRAEGSRKVVKSTE